MSERVIIQTSGGVADVRLNRPEKMNALDNAMFGALAQASQAVSEDPSVRAVVLSGVGRAFCAGLDFSSFSAMDGGGERSSGAAAREDDTGFAARIPTRGQKAAWDWQQCPVPVIAAIHGVAYGGGCQIALGADVRFMAPDAKMSIMEVKWGLIPDMAGSQTLRRLARLDVIKELTFTGRQISGEEAVALGLATHLSDNPLEDAMSLAQEIASKSPDSVRAAKRLLNESGLGTEQEGLALEWDLQSKLIGSANQLEAVRANFEKRPPHFKDPA